MSDTPEYQPFPAVTTSDLSRRPWQPFTSSFHDIYGWPVTGVSDECEKLSEAQRKLLSDGVRGGRLVPARLHGSFEFVYLIRAIENMAIRGLVEKTNRGWELTGRGVTIKETLTRGGVAD